MRRLLMVMVVAVFGLSPAGMAAAEGYPARAITVIVPFSAGGATDTVARFLAKKMRGIPQQSPEALHALQKAETERWWPIIKASNLKAE